MSNYNKVLLMGRLTRDPELRYTPQGTPVAEIGLAVNREYTVGTERKKDTAYVDITLWRRQAEVVCQYLKKGQPLFVEGHLSLDSWETQDGQKRSKLRVIAENFQFLGARGGGAAESSDEEGAAASRSYAPGGRGGDLGGNPGSRFENATRQVPASAEGDGAPEEGPLGLSEGEIPF
jgi:single-strand DNA-binding protein